MNRSGALFVVAGIALIANHAGATPPPPPGGYWYYNTSPATVKPLGQLIDHSSQPFAVSTDTSQPFTPAGTLLTQVYQEPDTKTLDFVYHITPAASGEMLHSVDVPWINNEGSLIDAGYVSVGNDAIPVTIARYDNADPVTFLFNYSFAPGASNLDNGTADLVVKTNAHAYTWSDAFTVRTLDGDNFNFSSPVGGFIPEHAPEPASVGVLGIGALMLLRRRR
jgi:hypothetical protein